MNRKLVSFDWAMKKLLRSKANFDILEGFLSELLKEDIKIIEILESEGNKETSDDKYNRVDLKVIDSKGEYIIIEVQHDRDYEFLQRILYASSKAITEHIKESEPYSEVKKVISVDILYFGLGQGTDYIYKGTTKFIGMNDNDVLQLTDTQKSLFGKINVSDIFPEYYLIRVNNFNDIAKNTLDEWIYFLKNEEIKDSFNAKGLKEAKRKLDIMKLPEAERKKYLAYKEELHYLASLNESRQFEVKYKVKKSRKKGRAEGLKKGLKKGRKEGIQKGRKEGIQKGKAEEKMVTAKKMKSEGLDIELISKITGLTKEEIDKL